MLTKYELSEIADVTGEACIKFGWWSLLTKFHYVIAALFFLAAIRIYLGS